MADGGKLAAFTFATIVYDADDCLQGWDMNDAIQDIVYQCNSYDKHAVGTRGVSFRASLALAATDTTKVTAFAPGTTGAFEAHPGGDTAGNIEITATKATVISAPLSSGPNNVIAIDVELALDDVTYTTAA